MTGQQLETLAQAIVENMDMGDLMAIAKAAVFSNLVNMDAEQLRDEAEFYDINLD